MGIISGSHNCPLCGPNHKSRCFYIYDDGYHCFSCGASKRANREFNASSSLPKSTVGLPKVITHPSLFSTALLKWLVQFHITDALIYKYGISQALDGSVVFPVYCSKTNSIIMYQRRWPCGMCGEFSCSCHKTRQIITYGTKTPYIINRVGASSLVLVEDFISAIRVGEITNCLCMFGLSIPHATLKNLVTTYSKIIIWADNDGPGQDGAKLLFDKLQKFELEYKNNRIFEDHKNRNICNIATEKDPKYYTKSEIINTLNQYGAYYEKQYN